MREEFLLFSFFSCFCCVNNKCVAQSRIRHAGRFKAVRNDCSSGFFLLSLARLMPTQSKLCTMAMERQSAGPFLTIIQSGQSGRFCCLVHTAYGALTKRWLFSLISFAVVFAMVFCYNKWLRSSVGSVDILLPADAVAQSQPIS